MINVKNAQLTNETISILNNLIEMDIKAGAAFKLMRIIKELSNIIEDKLKSEKKILDKWAAKDEMGNYLRVQSDTGSIINDVIKITNITKFEEDMNQLLMIDNNLSFDKIDFDELDLVDKIKVKDLLKIEFIFK